MLFHPVFQLIAVSARRRLLKLGLFPFLIGKRCTRLSKSDIRVQIVHSDHNATRGNDDEEDVKEPMVNLFVLDLRISQNSQHRDRNAVKILFSSYSSEVTCNSSKILGVPSGSKQQ